MLCLVNATLISVEICHGNTVMLEVRGSDTVDDVKSRIQKKEGIPANRQKLTFGYETVLQDTKNLCDYLIYRDCTLRLGTL